MFGSRRLRENTGSRLAQGLCGASLERALTGCQIPTGRHQPQLQFPPSISNHQGGARSVAGIDSGTVPRFRRRLTWQRAVPVQIGMDTGRTVRLPFLRGDCANGGNRRSSLGPVEPAGPGSWQARTARRRNRRRTQAALVCLPMQHPRPSQPGTGRAVVARRLE